MRHVLADGRVVYGPPESKHLHLAACFVILDADDGRRIWPGGRSMMPYWADGYTSPFLTDEEIERYFPDVVERQNPFNMDDFRKLIQAHRARARSRRTP
ncbi:MAG: hypothetical protein AMXMBFR77_26470 [Phycisphaerales bacterium]